MTHIDPHIVLFNLWYCAWLVLTLVREQINSSEPVLSVEEKEKGWRCFLFGKKSENPSSGKSVDIVIPYVGLKTYSGFEILEKRPLNGRWREIPEPP